MNSYANFCVNWEGGLSFNFIYLSIFINSLHATLQTVMNFFLCTVLCEIENHTQTLFL